MFCFIFNMFHKSLFSVFFPSSFLPVLAVSRPMMVITQKITSMAFEIHDGEFHISSNVKKNLYAFINTHTAWLNCHTSCIYVYIPFRFIFIFISFTYSQCIAHIFSLSSLAWTFTSAHTANKNVGAVLYLKNAGVHRASAAKSLVKLIKAQGDEWWRRAEITAAGLFFSCTEWAMTCVTSVPYYTSLSDLG